MTEVKLSRLGLQAVHNYVNSFLTLEQQSTTAFVDAKVVRRVVSKACDRSNDGTEICESYCVKPRPGIDAHTVDFKVIFPFGLCFCAC